MPIFKGASLVHRSKSKAGFTGPSANDAKLTLFATVGGANACATLAACADDGP
jgi:hypothetical protein